MERSHSTIFSYPLLNVATHFIFFSSQLCILDLFTFVLQIVAQKLRLLQKGFKYYSEIDALT